MIDHEVEENSMEKEKPEEKNRALAAANGRREEDTRMRDICQR